MGPGVEGGEGRLLSNGDRVSVQEDGKVLEMGGEDGSSVQLAPELHT